jgi:pimeloyl-ACP methyl ester carboxylesterase
VSRARAFVRGVGITGLAAGALGAGAYGIERVTAARLRARPDDPDADGVLEPVTLRRWELPSHDGGRISYVDVPARGTDRGIPIVLSHGVTLSVRTWCRQLEHFPAAGHRTIAFDHRGHGGSSVGSAGHSVENLAADVLTILEQLDLERVILVGHSMGGVAVQSFLLEYPQVAAQRVRGAVLLSTLAVAPGGSQSVRVKQFVERVSRRTPDTTRIWASPNFGFLLARLGFGRDPKPSHVELVRRMMLECPSDTRVDAPRSLIGLDLVRRLRDVTVPTLVIGGTADLLTPPHESRRIARNVPGARLELLPDAGHMVMLERTAEFERLVLDFAHDPAAFTAFTA